jgi:hypothetical protein
VQMQAVRERFLVEKMGLKYNYCHLDVLNTNKGQMKGGDYFMALFEWAYSQRFWGHFVETVIGMESDECGPLHWPIDQNFIDPENFATALYLYLYPQEEST